MRTTTRMGTISTSIKKNQFSTVIMGVMVLLMEGNSVVSLETITRIINIHMESQRKNQDA